MTGVQADPGPVEGAPARKPGLHRRLYDWVLHWADTPYGLTALVLLTAAESSFFPIPPDPLLMALCLAVPARSLRFAAWTTAASVGGAVLGYGIGALAWGAFQGPFFTYVPGVSPESFEHVVDAPALDTTRSATASASPATFTSARNR